MSDGYRGDLIDRRKDVQRAVNEFEQSFLYEIIRSDSEDGIRRLDETWTDVVLSGDQQKIMNHVILKLAARHLIALPERYKAELLHIDDLLDKEDNSAEVVGKDYDTESNYE